MDLNKEIFTGLGFKEIKVNDFDMWEYSANEIGSLCLEKTHREKEFYMIYKKYEDDNLKACGHCKDLAELFEMMMKINHISSMDLGKQLKQQEVKSVLGL
jgi:cytidine deaminase